MARTPQPPPKMTSDDVNWEKIIKHIDDNAIPDHYLHWDQIRFRQPPVGLSTKEWWQICKVRRASQKRLLSLYSPDGKPFSFQIPPQLHELLFQITMNGGGSIITPESANSTTERERHRTKQLIEEAISSSLIEGAVTTRSEAQKFLRDKRLPKNKSEQMIFNNYHAMQRLREIKSELLTPEIIFELHRILTENTLENSEDAGKFRTTEDDIVVGDQFDPTIIYHRPPPATELHKRIEALCDFANGKTPDGFLHPVVRSILLHFWLAYDHPFVDGNGRTARALFYWSMLHQGFWITEFLSISRIIYKSRRSYYDSFLYTESDENDTTYFLLHQSKILSESIESLREYMSKRASRMAEIDHRIHRIPNLNIRQKSLIEHALRHPNYQYTIQGHQEATSVVYQTARTDLLFLASKGFLIQSKDGRTMVFRPAPDLSTQLAVQ